MMSAIKRRVAKWPELFVPQHVWDELDAWHSRLMLLENEVQDLAEEHPDQTHLLIDQLTQPLQLYQNTAQMAEQRTAFLSKVRRTALYLHCAVLNAGKVVIGGTGTMVLTYYVSIWLPYIFYTPLSDPYLSSGVWRHSVRCHLLVRRGPVMAQRSLLVHNSQKPPKSCQLSPGQWYRVTSKHEHVWTHRMHKHFHMLHINDKFHFKSWTTAGPGRLWANQTHPVGLQASPGWDLCSVWHQHPGGEAGPQWQTSPQNATQDPRATGAAPAGCWGNHFKVVSDPTWQWEETAGMFFCPTFWFLQLQRSVSFSDQN